MIAIKDRAVARRSGSLVDCPFAEAVSLTPAATSVPNRVALEAAVQRGADARLGRRTGGGVKSRGEYFSRVLG